MEALSFKSIIEAEKAIKSNTDLKYVLHVPIDMIHDLGGKSEANAILVSTAGEYSATGYQNGLITGFSYDQRIGEAVEIKDPPILSKKALESAYQKVKKNTNALMFLFMDGLSGQEESVMTTLYFMKSDFKVIGGSAGDNLKFEETVIYMGKKRVSHVAIFLNIQTRTQLIKENIYIPRGEKLLITDADPINRVVYKINNKPATTEYARILGVSENKLDSYFMNHPLGKIYENDIMIASPQKVNSDKSITFYCQLMPNTFVHMLEPVDPREKVQETLNALLFKPHFMYVLNCVLRSLKFQEDNCWRSVDTCLLGACKNTTGFISYGEQYFKHHVNQTMVILAVE